MHIFSWYIIYVVKSVATAFFSMCWLLHMDYYSYLFCGFAFGFCCWTGSSQNPPPLPPVLDAGAFAAPHGPAAAQLLCGVAPLLVVLAQVCCPPWNDFHMINIHIYPLCSTRPNLLRDKVKLYQEKQSLKALKKLLHPNWIICW